MVCLDTHVWRLLVSSLTILDEEPSIRDPPWAWDTDDDPGMAMPRGHHHHHRPHRIPSPWTIFPGGPADRGMIGKPVLFLTR